MSQIVVCLPAAEKIFFAFGVFRCPFPPLIDETTAI